MAKLRKRKGSLSEEDFKQYIRNKGNGSWYLRQQDDKEEAKKLLNTVVEKDGKLYKCVRIEDLPQNTKLNQSSWNPIQQNCTCWSWWNRQSGKLEPHIRSNVW